MVLWSAMILSAANDSFSDEHSRSWLETVLGRAVHEAVNYTVRKTAHVAVYAVLAALAWRTAEAGSAWRAMAVAAAVAMTDETLQARTATRGGSPWDVLLDLSGATLATLLLMRVARARMSRQEES